MSNNCVTFNRIVDEATEKGFLDIPARLGFNYYYRDFFKEHNIVSNISDLLTVEDDDLQASINRRMLHRFTTPSPTIPEQAKNIGIVPSDYKFLLYLRIFVEQWQNKVDSDEDIIAAIRYKEAIKMLSAFFIMNYLSTMKNITNPKEVILCDDFHLYHIPRS